MKNKTCSSEKITMDSEADQPLLQPHEQEKQEPNFQTKSPEMGFHLKARFGQVILNLKQLKSLEILQAAIQIFTSNMKYMLLMVFSAIPFFIFMVFFEIELQKAVYVSHSLLKPVSHYYYDSYSLSYVYDDISNRGRAVLHLVLELCALHLVVYPLLELLSSSVIIKIAAKVYAAEKESSLKEVIPDILSHMNVTLKGCLSTSFWVQLLSTSTLVGLFSIVANYVLISGWKNWVSYYYYYDHYSYMEPEVLINALSALLHALAFFAVLYKYLDWSALWNMGMVISVMEEETGIEALEMSSYYAKRCRRTGFDLMLGFFAYGTVLRVPCMVVIGKLDAGVGGVMVTAIAVGFVCLGNLVKWIALVLYFYDCKAQTLQKKVDEEVGKGHDAC
uniref:Uncharacterized protein n=1 Tax=Opuntia streptacantha TaxID=393608 RepID=A0A7C9CLE2_OPUST